MKTVGIATANDAVAGEVYGMIIRVAFDNPEGDSSSNLYEYSEAVGLRRLPALLNRFGIQSTRRVITFVRPSQVRDLEQAVDQRDDRLTDLPSLNQYWKLDIRHLDRRDAERLLASLVNSEGEVADAYFEYHWSEPAAPCSDIPDEMHVDQIYLSDVGAIDWAWKQPGGLGQKVGVIDIETGWLLDADNNASHQDLADHKAPLLEGDNRTKYSAPDHGTAVLGIIAGLNNGAGISGIAPCLGRLAMVSAYEASTDTVGHVADALLKADYESSDGDILVIEQQAHPPSGGGFPGYPAEVDDATFLAIRCASEKKIVIEAAGNGAVNLSSSSLGLNRSLNPQSSSFIDSRAIMVSAGAKSNDSFEILTNSAGNPMVNYGDRIDCFARGNFIVTAGYDTWGNPSGYSKYDLSRTSAATAIVAGVAAIVQGMRVAEGHLPFDSNEMRDLLSTYGIHPNPASAVSFGSVMPTPQAIRQGRPNWF